VSRAKSPARASEREPVADFAAVAAEVTRSLRRRAVASVPLRPASEPVTPRTGEHRAGDHVVASLDTATVLSAAFLVEGELWHEFADAVADEQERHPLLHIELSGPWPPYDFVRLQFGA
jgi:hypothetical protein